MTSITNTTIADKITRSEHLPQNLQQCFEKALRLEASLQLSEGVNMAQKTAVMNVEVDTEDEINSHQGCESPDPMHVINVEKWVTSKEIANMMVINHLIIKQDQHNNVDEYDPIVGKWMTNLVATTPITAKAMKSLYAKLNRQKELKRTYRKRYKDLQAVVVTTTTTPTTTTHPVIAASSKVTQNIQPIKTSLVGTTKEKLRIKEKAKTYR